MNSIEAAGTKAASTVTYVAAATTTAGSTGLAVAAQAPVTDLVWGLTVNQWSVVGILGGLLFAAAGYLTNLYFQMRRERLIERRVDEALADE